MIITFIIGKPVHRTNIYNTTVACWWPLGGDTDRVASSHARAATQTGIPRPSLSADS